MRKAQATPVLALLSALLALGCDSGGVPSGTDDGGPADASAHDARPGASGDSLPLGAISFFKTTTCPAGWVAFAAGAGRFFVPSVGQVLPGTMHGNPLLSGEDRMHSHGIAATVEVGSTSFAGVAGGGNGGVSPAGSYGFSTSTVAASAGLPYVQLLVCFKSAAPVAAAAPVPSGTLLFFRSNCPSGWSQATATQGRWLVGVPEGASAGASFGGAALASDEQRRHAHAASGVLETQSHGIALASGCCAGGYARNGSYPFSVTTGEAADDLPYVELLQCKKD